MADAAEAKRRLKALLDDIESAKRDANLDLSGWDPRTVNGMVIRKSQAQEELTNLKKAYFAFITNSVVKVFVTGERAHEFAEAMKKDNVVVSATEAYADLAKGLEPTLDRERVFTTSQLGILGRAMQKTMEEHAIRSLMLPSLEPRDLDTPVPTFNDLVDRVKTAMSKTNGQIVATTVTGSKILERALELKVDNTVMAVIITDVPKEEQQSFTSELFGTQPTLTLEATKKKSNEDLIAELNKKIRQLFNKQ